MKKTPLHMILRRSNRLCEILRMRTLLFALLFCLTIGIQAQTTPSAKAPAIKVPVTKAPAAKTTTAAPITKIYSIVIKGGHVIDPKNNIDAIMDVAIDSTPSAGVGGGGIGGRGGGSGKIALVAKNIDVRLAREVIDAKGLYVTPGLIDIHSHNFWGTNGIQYSDGPSSLPPDGFTFRSGVTTIVDAGSPGWKNFATYRSQTIQRSRTRVLVWLNIVGGGMRGESRYESDSTDMNADSTAKVALANKDAIVGIKVAHYLRHDWIPVERGEKAAVMANNIPLMIDFGGLNGVTPLSIEELGNLSVGSDADIALLGVRTGKFGLFDHTGCKIETTKKLECEMTIRAGTIVYDLNGRAAHTVVSVAAPIIVP